MKLIKDLGMQLSKPDATRKRRIGLYECSLCGNQFTRSFESMKSGRVKSCGCYSNSWHGKSNHELYSVWISMISRCNNEKDSGYKDYGGRGVTVCKEWTDVNNFINDMYPSFVEGLEIDRKNNNLGYSKSNCRWTTRVVQAQNTRKIRSNNTSGYRGVSFYKDTGKFGAKISVNKKSIGLGYYYTDIEAAKVYDYYVISNNLEHTINGVLEDNEIALSNARINTSTVSGISLDKTKNKWKSTYKTKDNKVKHIGYYETESEAIAAQKNKYLLIRGW